LSAQQDESWLVANKQHRAFTESPNPLAKE